MVKYVLSNRIDFPIHEDAVYFIYISNPRGVEQVTYRMMQFKIPFVYSVHYPLNPGVYDECFATTEDYRTLINKSIKIINQ